jgi:hypothetical protein
MAQGADALVGHARGAVWNTAVTLTPQVNKGLLLNNWTIGNGLGPLIYSESLTGSGGRSNAIRGLNKLNGDVGTELRYSGLEHLFAMVMGSTGGAPTAVGTTGFKHTFSLTSNVDGLYDTVVVHRSGPAATPTLPVWEYPSLKYGGVVITFTADGLATVSVPVIASSCKPLTGQINPNLGTLTYRTRALNVYGTHIKFRANVATPLATAPALADTDKFYPSQIVLTFTRNLDSDYVMDGSGVQPEPYYTTFFEVTMAISFPVYGPGTLQANNTFMANAFSETPMKMDITCTSPQLADPTAPFSWLFEFPFVTIGNAQMPINDAGAIPQDVEVAALAAPSAPLGMTGLTAHFRATAVSQMNTDPMLNP